MIIGYARTSTVEQCAGIEAQRRDLVEAGAEKLFSEQVSSVAHRDALDRCIEFAREGDTLIVTKLEATGVALVILSMSGQRVDTTSPTGRMMLTMLGAVAEFERALMLERQREGIAAAKAAGRYKGRAPTARAKSAAVLSLAAQGLKRGAIAQRLGIGVASVYRVLAEHRPATDQATH